MLDSRFDGNRLLSLLVVSGLLGMTLASTGCQGADSTDPLEQIEPAPIDEPTCTSVLLGQVSDAATGDDIANVDITVYGRSFVTNEQGFFSIGELCAGERVTVSADREGFTRTQGIFSPAGTATSYIALSMLPVETIGAIEAEVGGRVTAPSGAIVDLPAGGIVDADGHSVTGVIDVELTYLDPSNIAALEASPGDFNALRADGTLAMIESFGMIDVTLRQGDALLNLADGAEATIEIPVPAVSIDNAPSDVPLWTYDFDRGLWVEEGALVATDLGGAIAYSGTVGHFSWWNADQVYDTTCLHVCVQDRDGRPVAGAVVVATGLDYNGQSQATTGADGCADLAVKRDARVSVTAIGVGFRADPITVDTPTEAMQPGDPECLPTDTLILNRAVAQIILEWSDSPRDLDSHLIGPSGHVSYVNRRTLRVGQPLRSGRKRPGGDHPWDAPRGAVQLSGAPLLWRR